MLTQKILSLLKDNPKKWYTSVDISNQLKIHKKFIQTRMSKFKKNRRVKYIIGYDTKNDILKYIFQYK